MSLDTLRILPDWQHPRNVKGDYIPLWPYSAYKARVEDWDTRRRLWDANDGNSRFMITSADGDYRDAVSFEEWTPIPRPTLDRYMPDWPAEQCTHYVMCRIHDDGYTPISPPCATQEELAQWLVSNDVSVDTSRRAPATKLAWLHIIAGKDWSCIKYKKHIEKYVLWTTREPQY